LPGEKSNCARERIQFALARPMNPGLGPNAWRIGGLLTGRPGAIFHADFPAG